VGIYPHLDNSSGKLELIIDEVVTSKIARLDGDEPAAYQLVGGVKAYQDYDGYPV